MLTTILFIAIGLKLQMPTWYYVVVGIKLFLNLIEALLKAFKAGREQNENS